MNLNRERNVSFTTIALFSDLFLVGLSFLIAYYEKRSLPGELASLGRIQDYGWFFLVYLILVMASLYFSGFYTFGRTLTKSDIVLGSVRSVVTAFAVLILFLFMIKEQSISRLFLGLLCLNNAILFIVVKVGFRQITGKMQEHGYNVINALVIGSEYPARRFVENIATHPELGYRILGCLDPDSERVGKAVGPVEVLGTIDQLDNFLEKMSIDEVFVAMPFHKIEGMNRIMYLCEEVGIRFSLCADWMKPYIAKTIVRTFLDFPVITYTSTPTAVGQLLVKAIVDRILAALGLIFLTPALLVMALAIKLSSPGPVIFKQRRAGLYGRPFDMLKFRTMVKEAEDLRADLESLNEMDGPVFKIENDPRVTRFGHFLRRSSLDELPQLINVLRGEMSLVGPRPPIPEEVEKYERWQRRRLSMKPGLTCYWQISGRNQVNFEEWMAMDLKYIDNWSLKLDFAILAKTIPVVLTGRGAH